ncbi:stAR-related lipid transfer protein 7, mitochondrial isoform X1 [Latimeria chalumnae]|uniref:stAR-related lipid transfer protein 7, mitochondrial isoform X1 n=1 Tax=Latimeria chalumnae TaxID=7897 RepID=UPI00313E7EFD
MFQSLQRTPKPGLNLLSVHPAQFSSWSLRCLEAWHLKELGKRAEEGLQWAWAWFQKGLQNGSRASEKRLVSLFASQCSYVTSQRLRRAQQIGQLYSNIYSERSRKSLFFSLWRRFQSRHSHTCKLVAAIAGVFMWDEERVKDEELDSYAKEMVKLQELTVNMMSSTAKQGWSSHHSLDPNGNLKSDDQSWEVVMERNLFKVWRRPIANTSLYQYRVLGTYSDITPRQFFNVQLDTEYRKRWDALVIKLEVVERDELTGSEVLHWVTHFPYPMYSREYVYVRRYHVDQKNNLMVMVSRTVEHPSVPESPDYVRVRAYQSHMVIRPHRTFDENGFDYLLTYSDDPQTVFPRYCIRWMVSSGMPDFLGKLHSAAVKAQNLEIQVKDYVALKASENGSKAKVTQNPERKGEAAGSPQQMEYI